MARSLKTFFTSIGFFDLAVTAPSMKAALEAWGAQRNLFHQGLAWETDDAAIIKATMAKPGVVMKRAVGTKGTFQEKAELPTELPASAANRTEGRKVGKQKRIKAVPSPASEKAQKAAVVQFDQEKARRERERAREEADRSKREAIEAREVQQRARETDRIQAQLDKVRDRHEKALADIQEQRDGLDRKADAEKRRWNLERRRFESELKKL
jgi:hypothetical protein